MKINHKFIFFLFELYTLIIISKANCDLNNTCTNQVQFLNVSHQDTTKCPNVKSSEVLLSRRRRALKFPDNSNFVVSTTSFIKTFFYREWKIVFYFQTDYYFFSQSSLDRLASRMEHGLRSRRAFPVSRTSRFSQI